MHTARAQGCKSQWLCDKHNCPQRDSIPGPRALQSDMLPVDHCDQDGGIVGAENLQVGCHSPKGVKELEAMSLNNDYTLSDLEPGEI